MSEITKAPTDRCILADLAGAREFAKQSGYELDVSRDRYVDDQHLLPVWYGGYIGALKFRDGWQIVVKVAGTVDLTVSLKDGDGVSVEVDYENEDNTGAIGSDLIALVDDARLQALDEDGYVVWRYNNWMEYDFIAPEGRFIDCSMFHDNTIDDADVLSVFSRNSQLALIETLDELKSEYDVHTGKLKPI